MKGKKEEEQTGMPIIRRLPRPTFDMNPFYQGARIQGASKRPRLRFLADKIPRVRLRYEKIQKKNQEAPCSPLMAKIKRRPPYLFARVVMGQEIAGGGPRSRKGSRKEGFSGSCSS